MSPPSIQSRWKIDETRRESLWDEIGNEKVQPDGVHAMVRVACEQFGSTLAICDDTLDKVKTAVSETPRPATVPFLGATVVHPLNDPATKLVKSIEGQRFLGLAAAVTTLFSLYDGAKALQAMLESTASDTTIFPKAPQLKNLLGSLQGRLCQAGFSECVMEWQIKLQRDVIAAEGHLDGSMSFFSQSAPSPEMVTELVDVFHHLSKDDSAITGVTIKATEAAAWVVAFIEWCLGSSPSIYMGGSQQPLSQPGSVITLIITKTPRDQLKGLEITIHDSLNHRDQLTAPPSTKPFFGMATIGNYGKWLLEQFGFSGASLDLLHEALDHAIPQTLETFRWVKFDFSEQEHRDSTQDARCELLQLSSSCPSQVSPVPLNAFNDLKVFWKVETQDNRKLSIALSVQSGAGHQSFVRINPMLSFSTLKKALLIEGCRSHGQRSTHPSSLYSYTSPMDNHKKACDSASAVDFVPVSGSNDLRFVSLVCTRESVILRKDACVACCLNLCYEVGYHVLIL
ncbi:hypothetical protein FBULB1_7531 [Fusarium bulbicola]|nr:hypothetical protein FBULB1_7531 [Fusarium bulbicola]